MERERSGDGHLLDEEDDEVEVEVEVEVDGEGDMYLEETCLPLGLRGTVPLSFSEGRSGGLNGFWRVCDSSCCLEEILPFSGSVEAASEIAATIIELDNLVLTLPLKSRVSFPNPSSFHGRFRAERSRNYRKVRNQEKGGRRARFNRSEDQRKKKQ